MSHLDLSNFISSKRLYCYFSLSTFFECYTCTHWNYTIHEMYVFEEGNSTSVLQQAQLEITDINECADAYKNIPGTTIDDRVICAESPLGKDACQVRIMFTHHYR